MSASRPTLSIGVFVAIVACVAALIAPVMRGAFPAGHDAPAHLTYTYLFDRAIVEGQFPVRWIEWVRAGHGQPLFNFYQPGLYYIVQAIHLGVPSLSAALKMTVLLLWWASAGFVFLLLRRFGTLPAGAGAVCFAFSPYLLLDVFVRSAYPELAGISFGVGLLWAIDGWLRHSRLPWLIAVIVAAALLLVSHPPTAVIFTPLLAIYIGHLAATRQTTTTAIAALVPAALLSAGLSAFYILPAIGELHLIRTADLTRGGFDYHQHFVFPSQWLRSRWGFGGSTEGPGDEMSFEIGAGQWAAFALSAAIVVADLVRRRSRTRTIELAAWLAAASVAMLLMTGASVALWDRLPPLAFIQFPWRFLMVVSVVAAALSAHLLSLVPNRRVQAVLVLCTIGVQVQLAHARLVPKGYIARARMDIDWRDWRDSPVAEETAFIEKGYFPTSLQPDPEETVGRWSVDRKPQGFREISMKGHDLQLELTVLEPTVLRINSPAFPGWQVWVDGSPSQPAATRGYLAVRIPPGTHLVHARFTNTPTRRWANTISVLSAALVLAFGAISVVRACAFRTARRTDDPWDRSGASAADAGAPRRHARQFPGPER